MGICKGMTWAGLLAGLATVAGPAAAKLYHPEYLHRRHGPALIDCAHGFDSALRGYFRDYAKKDGLAVEGTPTLTIPSPKLPMSRFTAHFPNETFEGFIYVDPTMTEGEEEPWEDEGHDADAVCSASFVDSHSTPDERRQIDLGWNETISRLYLDDKVKRVDLP